MIPVVFKLVQIVLLFRGTTAYHMRKKDSSFKLAKTVKTDVTYFEASSACPCINPWENYNVPISESTVECDSDQILVAEGTISGQIQFSCKPLNYGSELCRPWDMYEGWYSDGCLGDEPKRKSWKFLSFILSIEIYRMAHIYTYKSVSQIFKKRILIHSHWNGDDVSQRIVLRIGVTSIRISANDLIQKVPCGT